MPAFVYFFKMLYPSIYPIRVSAVWLQQPVAAFFHETQVIKEVGGFKAIRDQLIDDCAWQTVSSLPVTGHGLA
jgi:hypothetical protein